VSRWRLSYRKKKLQEKIKACKKVIGKVSNEKRNCSREEDQKKTN
jgi:hypothetical protein